MLLHSPSSPSCSEASNEGSKRPLLKSQEPVLLFRLPVRLLIFCTFFPSIGSLLLVFLLGFGLNYTDLLNYEWTCGKVLLPSVSRIINLPAERIVWHVGMMLHAALRPIFIAQAYLLNSRPARRDAKFAVTAKLMAYVTAIAGILELVFTIALTVVGERESGPIHVYFFVGFIISCAVYQISSNLSCWLSKAYQTHRSIRFSWKVRVGLTTSLLVLVPSIFLFFVLYWQYCLRIAYDFFASMEYLTIIAIYAYHISSVIDLRMFQCQLIKCK